MELIEEQLKRKGYDTQSAEFRAAFDGNDIVKQIRATEKVIHDELAIQQKEAPIPTMKSFTEEQIEKYRMAAGALSDVWTRIVAMKQKDVKPPTVMIGKTKLVGEAELQLLFERVLERAAELWEAGGRFNTVTPGAKIAADQALALTMVELQGVPEQGKLLPAYRPLDSFKMQEFIPQYMNIVTGRFGHNQGMEDKGIGDSKLRDAFLLFQAMQTINKAIAGREITTLQQGMLARSLNGKLLMSDSGFDLTAKDMQKTFKRMDIGEFRLAVENAHLDKNLREKLEYQLTPDRSPDPDEGLAEGQKVVEKLRGTVVKVIRDIGMMSKALNRINAAIDAGKVTSEEFAAFTIAADIGGGDGKQFPFRLRLKAARVDGKPAGFQLGETDLEKQYLDKVLTRTKIESFRGALSAFKDEGLRRSLHMDLTPLDVKELHETGAPISGPDIAPVMAMLMRDGSKSASDAVFERLIEAIAASHEPQARAGSRQSAVGAVVA